MTPGDSVPRRLDGYITEVGRTDEVFQGVRASDQSSSPLDLESVLIEHSGVAEATVVPSPDLRRLELPDEFVALRVGTIDCVGLRGAKQSAAESVQYERVVGRGVSATSKSTPE